MTPEQALAGFIAKFTPEMAKLVRAARKKVQRLVPGALELAYDNYNFMVIAYGPTEKAGDALLSLAAYAKGLNLFFARGKRLPDPEGLLTGAGATFRSVRVPEVAVLDRPAVKALIAAAVADAKVPIAPGSKRRLIIKAVSPKQRPRR